MHADRRPAAIAKSLLAVSILFTTPGCITVAMWDDANRGGCPKPAAAALTPVTLALDVTLIAGWIWLQCEGGGDRCCAPPRDCR